MRPTFDADIALMCVDERSAHSLVGNGFLERENFGDACALVWIDDELVHLQDLVLHDATRDIRTPTRLAFVSRAAEIQRSMAFWDQPSRLEAQRHQ